MARRPLRARVLALAAVVACLAGVLLPAAVMAADPTFGKPTISSSFEQGSIELTQPVELGGPIARAEVLLTTADAIGPQVIEVPPPTGSGSVTLRYTISSDSGGHILPNTPISARWRLTPAGDGAAPVEGPVVSEVYADERFTWQTLTGDIVRVHWYEGGQAFGQRALRIGEEAIADTEKLLGVTETEPVDFFIYADQSSFYDALGPGTRENVGGQANADIRTLFALITPAEIDDAWVGVVVPHELVHLVFDTAVRNPYHFPPRWLNEGLAVYQSQGYNADDRRTVGSHAGDGTLIPLDGLEGQFPTTQEGFFLAYAESVSAVDYLIRTYSQDALVSLIRSYADGRTDDEAFTEALGVDTAAFNDAWLADLGAVVPTKQGPALAPPGPLPADWTGAPAAPGASGAPAAGASAGAGAAASPRAASTNRPGGAIALPGSAGSGTGTVVLAVAVVLVLLAIGGLLVRRRSVSAGPPPNAGPP